MIRLVRGLARLMALALWTVTCYAAVLGGAFLLWLARRETRGWRLRVMQVWARGCLRCFGVRLEVLGEPPVPPFFLTANHLSYLDILVLGALSPGVFVAKSEIARWPIFGALCRAANVIFIDRARARRIPEVNRIIASILDAGFGVLLFPEGSSTSGREVRPFKSSLLHVPVQRNMSVVPVALSYRAPPGETPAEKSICWWGDMTLLGHLPSLLSLTRIHARAVFCEAVPPAADRRALASALHREVAEAFVPPGDSTSEQGARAAGGMEAAETDAPARFSSRAGDRRVGKER